MERFDQDHVFFAWPPRSLSFSERDLGPMRSDLRPPLLTDCGWLVVDRITGGLDHGKKRLPIWALALLQGCENWLTWKSHFGVVNCTAESLVFVGDSEANSGGGNLTLGGFRLESNFEVLRDVEGNL